MAAHNFPNSPSDGDTTTLNSLVYSYNSTKTRWEATGTVNIVDDTTPQLGGNLDMQSHTVGGATAAELGILAGCTSTTTELNLLDGVTSTTTELNLLDGVTSTTTELNLLDGVTATTAELNYVDVTTLGTTEASKAVTADAAGKVKFIGTSSIAEVIEKVTVDSSTTGTINLDILTQAVMFFNVDQTANRTINFRGDGSTTLNATMANSESMTVAILMKEGSTPYYLNTFQIDGVGVTPEWQGGTAPSAGNASSIDVYTFTIVKTASATYTVLASQTKFA